MNNAPSKKELTSNLPEAELSGSTVECTETSKIAGLSTGRFTESDDDIMNASPLNIPPPAGHPLPVNWLRQAARLPGKSIHLAVALAACRPRDGGKIELTNTLADNFGLDRASKYRALAWLENEGLVTVVRKSGRAPMVTVNWQLEFVEPRLG